MNWPAFETRVTGKWVLAGEHAVLRGQMAVALPHPELGLSLHFEPAAEPFAVEPVEAAKVIGEMLSSVPELAGKSPSGLLRIASTVPVGAGLGSSAALCVAVTRWLAGPLHLRSEAWLNFATQLENRFHGKSSGMDVAAILADSPICFKRGQGAEPLIARTLPRFTFHDTGKRASTRQCVAQVEAFGQANPGEARRMDEQMGRAALQAALGLKHYGAGDTAQGLKALTTAMNLSHECFEAWELVPVEGQALRQELMAQGALSAKLTGAGSGGFVVALWDR